MVGAKLRSAASVRRKQCKKCRILLALMHAARRGGACEHSVNSSVLRSRARRDPPAFSNEMLDFTYIGGILVT